MFEAFIMFIGFALLNAFTQVFTGFALNRQDALKTEQNVAVFKNLGQFLIINMRRIGTLVNILRYKIVLQATTGILLTTITFQTGQKNSLHFIKN